MFQKGTKRRLALPPACSTTISFIYTWTVSDVRPFVKHPNTQNCPNRLLPTLSFQQKLHFYVSKSTQNPPSLRLYQDNTYMADTYLRKIFCRVEYLGAGYSGWQTQRNSPVRTISGALEGCLSAILPTEKCKKFILVGASRTDAGVSAAGNAFHIKLYYAKEAVELPEKFFRLALNSQLGRNDHSIRILETKEVPYGFHAQRTVGKVYRYCVTTDNSVFYQDRAMVIPTELDVNMLKTAAKLLTGPIHAQNFSKRHQETDPPERLIEAITVETKGKEVNISFQSAGFAWHQVRYMAGCLVECGLHQITLDQVRSFATGRCSARPLLAPAAGLCLQRVEYDPFWGV